MIAKVKLVFQIVLMASMLGLGILSLVEHRAITKEFGLGVLYTMANTIIFIL